MLRHLFVASAFILTASAAEAQQHALDVGSLQIGGSASLTSTETDDNDDRMTTISLNPRVHYFVAERLAIGADINLSYAKFADDVSARALGIGPSVTYYFGAPPATVHPYLSARVSFASIHFKSPAVDNDGSARAGSAAAGILTMLSRAVGLTTELFYRIDRQENESVEIDTNTFGLAVGIAAFVF